MDFDFGVKPEIIMSTLFEILGLTDNEKEAEMQIGHPTDVKHVAHIGWDGPSVNSPSWVRFFKFTFYSLNFRVRVYLNV